MVRNHLEMYGFDKTYKVWIFHGETFGVGSNMNSLRYEMLVDDIHVELNARDAMVTMVQEGRGIPHTYDNMSNDEGCRT